MKIKFYIFLLILLCKGNLLFSQHNKNSIDSNVADNLYSQAVELYKISNFDEAINIAEKSYQLSGENKMHVVQINSALLIAQIYLKKDLISYTLKYFLNALEISKKINDKNTQTQVFIDIALIYFKLNIYDKAYEYLLSAYNVQKEMPDSKLKIKTQEYLVFALLRLTTKILHITKQKQTM